VTNIKSCYNQTDRLFGALESVGHRVTAP